MFWRVTGDRERGGDRVAPDWRGDGRQYGVWGMRASILTAGVPTFSGEVYPRVVLQRMLEDSAEAIINRRVVGQIGDIAERVTYFSKVSHFVKEMGLLDDLLWADIEVLETPNGKILRKAIRSECRGCVKFKLSHGTWEEQGSLRVYNNMRLTRVDAVIDERFLTRRYRPIDSSWEPGW